MARVAHARQKPGQLAFHAKTTVVGGNRDEHLPVPYPRPALSPGDDCSPPRITGQGQASESRLCPALVRAIEWETWTTCLDLGKRPGLDAMSQPRY